MNKYRRFSYTSSLLIVDPKGDLIEYTLYQHKSNTIDEIKSLIGEELIDADLSGGTFTLDNDTCKALARLLEEA